MKQKLFLFFILLVAIPLVTAGNIGVSFQCDKVDCKYLVNDDVTVDVYLNPTTGSSNLVAFQMFILSDDVAADQFSFVDDANQNDFLFNQEFGFNAPDSNYNIGTNNYGWQMFDLNNVGVTFGNNLKVGSIKGKALSAGTVTLSLLTDASSNDDVGTYFKQSGGLFTIYHTFSSNPLAITISGACVPSCADKECGDDGCGGSCGDCAAGSSCSGKNKCVPVCTKTCTNADGSSKQCGSDGCGGVCGTCAEGQSCGTNYICYACTPNCIDSSGNSKQCGADGCGGVCGSLEGNCPAGQKCTQGNCIFNQISVGSQQEYDILNKIDLFNKDKFLESIIDVASNMKTYFKGTTSEQKIYEVVHTERMTLLTDIKSILDDQTKSKLQKVSLIAFKLKNIPEVQ